MSHRERVIHAIELLQAVLASSKEILAGYDDDAPEVKLYADWMRRLRRASAESDLTEAIELMAKRN